LPEPQKQSPPGLTAEMDPQPDHGERSYRGSGRMAGKRALVTGADGDVPPREGGGPAHGPGRVDHRLELDQLRPAKPDLVPYAATKAGIANMCAGLAQMLGPRGGSA